MKVLCVGSNYARHVAEMASAHPTEPIWFWKPTSSIIEDGDAVVIPPGIGDVHHEVELAVRIGRDAHRVAVDIAMDHIDAFTVAVDVTARTLQAAAKKAGRPWAQAKGFDTFLPLGDPVPRDDVDLHDMRLRLSLDGEERQHGTTSDMTWRIDELVSLASQWTTLRAGDWLLTGTPDGVGPLLPGQEMVAEIVGHAVLENPIRAAD